MLFLLINRNDNKPLCCQGWNSTATLTTNNSCPEGMTQCLFEEVVTLDYMVYFNFFGCVLLPLVVMLVIYIHIFMAARRQLIMISLKFAHTPAPGVKAPSSGSSRSTLQREVHAAKSLAIIVGLFALCWLPLHILNCFNHICEDCERPHIWVMNIAIIFSHANSVVNPLIYAYRIREFRQTFRRILYQHILGRMFGNPDGGGVTNNSIMRTASRISKEGSSCSTIVNSYVLDHSADQTGSATGTKPRAPHEPAYHWTSDLDATDSSKITNGHKTKSGTLSAPRQPACIMDFSAPQSATDVLEVKQSGSCIAFVNVHTFSQTECAGSSKLTEVSS